MLLVVVVAVEVFVVAGQTITAGVALDAVRFLPLAVAPLGSTPTIAPHIARNTIHRARIRVEHTPRLVRQTLWNGAVDAASTSRRSAYDAAMLSEEHAHGTTPIQALPGRRGALIVQERAVIAGYGTRVLRAPGTGPTAVLLHGFGDSADTWSQVLGRLAHEGRAAVALDMPGFARADALRPEPVLPQLVTFARAAATRFAERGQGSVLVGNSLGGAAALLAGQGTGPPLRRIVAIAPAGFDMARWIYRLETFSLLQASLQVPGVPLGVLHGIVARIYREMAIYDQRAVDRHVVQTFVGHYLDRRTAIRYLRVARRMRPELSTSFVLDDVRVPVEVIWGRQDRMLDVNGAEKVQEAIPHAHVEILEECGHCPQVECADETAALLLDALAAAEG